MVSNTVVLSRADAQALDKAVHALAFAVEDVRALTGADNPANGLLGLIPNKCSWGQTVLELVFVLLELGLVLLNLFESLSHRLQRRHDVLRQVRAVNDWNSSIDGRRHNHRRRNRQHGFFNLMDDLIF